MRVAPIGLYFNVRGRDIRDICRYGAMTAAMTHGHPLGWMPAAEDLNDIEAIHQLGEGRVAEETLAVAVYCDQVFR